VVLIVQYGKRHSSGCGFSLTYGRKPPMSTHNTHSFDFFEHPDEFQYSPAGSLLDTEKYYRPALWLRLQVLSTVTVVGPGSEAPLKYLLARLPQDARERMPLHIRQQAASVKTRELYQAIIQKLLLGDESDMTWTQIVYGFEEWQWTATYSKRRIMERI